MSKNTETKDPSAQGSALNISKRSFIIAIAIIFALMVTTYILTLVVPGGEYARTIDANGNTIIDTAGGFRYVAGGLPFWKWLLSPFLVLGAEGNGTIIAVMVFLLVIGGVFNSLNCCGLMQYMLVKIVYRFGHVRYTLMAVLTVFFMAMGSLVGSFEEVIPMVPIVVRQPRLGCGNGACHVPACRRLRFCRGRCQSVYNRRGAGACGPSDIQRNVAQVCILLAYIRASASFHTLPCKENRKAPSGCQGRKRF